MRKNFVTQTLRRLNRWVRYEDDRRQPSQTEDSTLVRSLLSHRTFAVRRMSYPELLAANPNTAQQTISN